MSIANIVLGGFGNGTVVTTLALVVTRGYAIGEAADVPDMIFVTNFSDYQPRAANVTAYPPRATVSITESQE